MVKWWFSSQFYDFTILRFYHFFFISRKTTSCRGTPGSRPEAHIRKKRSTYQRWRLKLIQEMPIINRILYKSHGFMICTKQSTYEKRDFGTQDDDGTATVEDPRFKITDRFDQR